MPLNSTNRPYLQRKKKPWQRCMKNPPVSHWLQRNSRCAKRLSICEFSISASAGATNQKPKQSSFPLYSKNLELTIRSKHRTVGKIHECCQLHEPPGRD